MNTLRIVWLIVCVPAVAAMLYWFVAITYEAFRDRTDDDW